MTYLNLWPEQKNYARGDFWTQFDDIIQSLGRAPAVTRDAAFAPRLDIEEQQDKYVLHFDIPGLKLEDISVEFRDETLFVTGERKLTKSVEENGLATDTEQAQFNRRERFSGRFERAITLPRDVASDRIAAHYEAGVLEVVIPKAEAALAKKIEVKAKV